MPYPATPKTWVAGDVLTAAQLNAELRDALLAIFPLGPPDAAWTGYTPTLTQSGTVTKTTTYARYTRIGRLIVAQWSLAVTAAGTAANPIRVTLPVTAALASFSPHGSGIVFDASANLNYMGVAVFPTTTTCDLLPASTDASSSLGQSVMTAALASGDVVSGHVIYESAT